MLKRLVDRIATPPATDSPPRWLFLTLTLMMSIILAIEFSTWMRGGGLDLRQLITNIGMLLLMLFFYSRQRQIRLVSFVGGFGCLWFGMLRDLHRFLIG